MKNRTNRAPIVIFTYKRLSHLKQTVESLGKNILAKESDLILYSDAAKTNADSFKVDEIRRYIKTIKGFRSVETIERKENFGLSKNIICGVSEVVEKYGKVIVLEDDMVTSRYFLKYMNEGLAAYRDDDNVISIHGYVYPVNGPLPETFFLPGADCWGWATWQRAWKYFEPDGVKLKEQLEEKGLVNKLNWGGAVDYFGMLKDQIAGRNDSWAVRWLATAIINNKYTLYPGKTLVKNIGLDGSGVHCGNDNNLTVDLHEMPVEVVLQNVEVNKQAYENIRKYFNNNKITVFRRIKNMTLNQVRKFLKKNKYGWFGDFKTWQEASDLCKGYGDEKIIDKVTRAVLKVKSGEAVYERDSVLFDRIEYSWPVLAGLMWSAARHNGKLTVIDFGGSLGSTYFQNKKFFSGLKHVEWNVAEQKKFAAIGKEKLTDNNLRFFDSDELEKCLELTRPSLFLFSSVLQYMEKPYDVIKRAVDYGPDMIIVDRTSFVLGNEKQRLTLQTVDPVIYEASYPCWFFNEKEFVDAFTDKYNLVESFDALDIANIPSKFKGMIFIKKI